METGDWLPAPERVGEASFAASPLVPNSSRVFGGEIMAQSCRAAAREASASMRLHAASTHFLRPGQATQEIVYHLEHLSNGRTFRRRLIRACQQNRPIAVTIASYVDPEHFAPDGPHSRPPERLTSAAEEALLASHPVLHAIWQRRDALEKSLCLVEDGGRVVGFWFRAASASIEDFDAPQVALYASDRLVLPTALVGAMRSTGQDDLTAATLNHDFRIQASFDPKDWLFLRARAEIAGIGRVLCSGTIHDAAGNRVATFAQEGLVTPPR